MSRRHKKPKPRILGIYGLPIEVVLLCRNNASISVHVKTQNRVKHRVWNIDPWPDPTRPQSL